MISTLFLEGMILGFGATVPIGPINILIMSHALKKYNLALAIGFGAMSADMVYLFLMTFGLLNSFENPLLLKNLAIFGFIFLLVIGIALLKGAGQRLHVKKDIKQKGVFTTFTQGLVITLLNPYTIGFWLSIASLAKSKQGDTKVLVGGVVVAILLWITIMPFIVHSNKHRISDNIAKYFSYFAGVVLIFFAFVLLYNTFGEKIL